MKDGVWSEAVIRLTKENGQWACVSRVRSALVGRIGRSYRTDSLKEMQQTDVDLEGASITFNVQNSINWCHQPDTIFGYIHTLAPEQVG